MMIKSKSPLYAFVGPRWIGEHRAASPSKPERSARCRNVKSWHCGVGLHYSASAYRSEMPTNRIFGSTTSRSAFVLWPGAA